MATTYRFEICDGATNKVLRRTIDFAEAMYAAGSEAQGKKCGASVQVRRAACGTLLADFVNRWPRDKLSPYTSIFATDAGLPLMREIGMAD